jgi:uncharacterized protein (TIGR02611 family)
MGHPVRDGRQDRATGRTPGTRDEGAGDEAGDEGAWDEGTRGEDTLDEAGDEPGLLDEIADRFRFRRFLRRHKGLEIVYRIVVAVLGVAIVVTGFALIPLPGPGWLIVFGGLAVLATEFAWAERLLHYGQAKFRAWTGWVLRQSLAVRALITLLGLALVAGVLGLYVKVQGVPGWLPFIG